MNRVFKDDIRYIEILGIDPLKNTIEIIVQDIHICDPFVKIIFPVEQLINAELLNTVFKCEFHVRKHQGTFEYSKGIFIISNDYLTIRMDKLKEKCIFMNITDMKHKLIDPLRKIHEIENICNLIETYEDV